MKIAFLGLGRMGSGMAARLARAGGELTVWNRSPGKAEPLAALGATTAASPDAAVAGADLVMTSLMDDASVEALFGANAPALNAMRENAIHLCATTISPDCAARLASAHAHARRRYVSGPVVGRPEAAASAHCPLDIAVALEGKMREAVALGMGERDWSAIQEITRARAGLDSQK